MTPISPVCNKPLPGDLVDWLPVCDGDLTGPDGLRAVRHSPNVTGISPVLTWSRNWCERGRLPRPGIRSRCGAANDASS
jgi:hypothetical protein